MICIDAIWTITEPLDKCAGIDKASSPALHHYAYLFSNARNSRMEVLVHEGLGPWPAARRLNRGVTRRVIKRKMRRPH